MGIDATRPAGREFAERLAIPDDQRARARSILAAAGVKLYPSLALLDEADPGTNDSVAADSDTLSPLRERLTEDAARVAADYELLRGRYFSDRFSTSVHSVSVSFTAPTNLLVNSVCVGGAFLTPI